MGGGGKEEKPGEKEKPKEEENYLEFFTGYFCPYAQMTWIALNEKMKS